jgi:hypothetical protein
MKKDQELVAFGNMLVFLGIVFSTERLIGYSFIGAGVLLSVISVIRSKKKVKEKKSQI